MKLYILIVTAWITGLVLAVAEPADDAFHYRMRLTDDTGESLIRRYTPVAAPPVHGAPPSPAGDSFMQLTDDPRDPRAEQMREFYEWFKESPYAAREFQRHVRRTHTYVQGGEFERAGIEAHLGLSLIPDDKTLLFLAGRIYARRGLYSRADEYWSRLVELEPDNVAYLAGRGGVQVRLRRFTEAERLLRRANDLQPYYTPTLFNLACLYVASGRFDRLPSALGSLTSQDIAQMADWLSEEFDEFMTLMGEPGYLAMGQILLRGADRLDEGPPTAAAPPDFLMFSPSGEAPGLFFDDAREAITDAETVRIRLRSVSRLLAALGRAMQQEQWADAARIGSAPEIVEWGLTASAVRADALYTRFRAEEYADAALGDLRRLLRRHPYGLIARMRLATALMDQGGYTEAEGLLYEGRSLYPDHMGIQLLLACTLAEQGQDQEALAVLEQMNLNLRPFIRGWFAVESPYKSAVLSRDSFIAWRNLYGVQTPGAGQSQE